jgi:hypothetical protein
MKMRTLTLAAGILAASFSLGASAAVDPLGDVSTWTYSPTLDEYTHAITGATGVNQYSFTLSSASNFYDLLVGANAARGGGTTITGYTLTLSGGSIVGSITESTSGKVGELTISNLILKPGSYDVSVTAIGKNSATFGGTIGISPVPVPAALFLFGSAITGAGLFGARRRRKAQTA